MDMQMDAMARQEMVTHIKDHMSYPATKQAIVEMCNNMAHVPESARQMVADKLPDRMYNSADEVMKALKM
jgi:hypothetical protein